MGFLRPQRRLLSPWCTPSSLLGLFIKISLGLSENEIKSDQDEYHLVDHDEDWEYLGSDDDDDDQSIGTKELISLLSLMKG